jgi:glycosyltransferase involved in cell wall biosynthesis
MPDMHRQYHRSLTVVIPHYNRAGMLHRALISVASQSLVPSQVIVIDDCSLDEIFQQAVEICDKMSGKINLTILRNNRNYGANYCRNIGINLAESKYIAFLDSDDFWFPQKLSKQMQEIDLQQQGDARPILSFTGRYRIDGDGRIMARQFGGRSISTKSIRETNFIGPLSSVVVDAKLARQIGGFDETLRACQDWEFFIRASEYAQLVGIPDPLCVYVDHDGDRISDGHKDRVLAILYIYAKHSRQNKAHRSAFFRTLAEEYQELGRIDRARKLYFASLSSTGVRGVGANLNRSLRMLQHVLRWGSLKGRRYSRYKRGFHKAMRDPYFKAEVNEHERHIQSVIGCG